MPEGETERSRITWNPEHVFTGTAWYYSRFRPGYPEEVFQVLQKKFSLHQSSRVLDLGCGTGQIALPVSALVREVIAIDPQEEMLKEGRSLAAANNVNNIQWLLGESASLSRMAASIGRVNLTTIARAFHWMDREQTLKDLFTLTQPGGGIAIIGDSGTKYGLKLPWKEVVDQSIKHWLGEERKAGIDGTYSHPNELFETILEQSAFQGVEVSITRVERTWSIDQIIGYLYSTSYCSLLVLGDEEEPFETETRTLLEEREPSGQFKEPVIIEIIMGWKPLS